MKTIIEKTEDRFCQLCTPARERMGLEPKRLVLIGYTIKHKLDVYACPVCDLMESNE